LSEKGKAKGRNHCNCMALDDSGQARRRKIAAQLGRSIDRHDVNLGERSDIPGVRQLSRGTMKAFDTEQAVRLLPHATIGQRRFDAAGRER
jgi:hypothetical protein